MFIKIILLLIFCILVPSIYLSFGVFDTEDVIVAVIDTGLDTNILDTNNVITGFDFIDFDRLPMDKNGHGTMMTEIIQNLAPQAKIIPIRFLDQNKSYTMLRPIAILYAIIHGADIINMSFNGDGDLLTKLVIQYGNAKGVIFVGSTGNKGLANIEYPAKYKEVLAIGGYDTIDHTYYGSYGEDVDFVAPANFNCELGTSISAAYMSGVIAYLKCCYPQIPKCEILNYLYKNARKVNVHNTYQLPYVDFQKLQAVTEVDLGFVVKGKMTEIKDIMGR